MDFSSACLLIGTLATVVGAWAAIYYPRKQLQLAQMKNTGTKRPTVEVPIKKLLLLPAVCLVLTIFTWLGPRPTFLMHTTKEWESFPKAVVVNEHFNRQTVVLDGHRYINCKFDDVTFVYNGDPYEIDGIKINGSVNFSTENMRIANFLVLLKRLNFFRPDMPPMNISGGGAIVGETPEPK